MKTGIAIAFLLISSTSLLANESSFLTHYGDAIEQARMTAQPLLIVISRDAGLPHPIEPAEASASRQDPLKSYVVCKIDANSEYGMRVAAAFRVKEFPHSVIIDKTGKRILYRKAGAFSNESWAATLEKFEGGSRPQAAVVHQAQFEPQAQPQRQANSPGFVGTLGNSGLQSGIGRGLGSFGRSRPFCRT